MKVDNNNNIFQLSVMSNLWINGVSTKPIVSTKPKSKFKKT